jgi:hypothetical protein
MLCAFGAQALPGASAAAYGLTRRATLPGGMRLLRRASGHCLVFWPKSAKYSLWVLGWVAGAGIIGRKSDGPACV